MSDFVSSYKIMAANQSINLSNLSWASTALAISRNDVHHHRTKHIDIKHHFIRDHVKSKRIALTWMPTQQQVADILTKPLDKIKFTQFN